MLLWTLIALMTGAAALAALWPLGRRDDPSASTPEPSDVAIYRDQLAELDRDAERGLIGEAEGKAARVEIARRLLAAGRLPVAAPEAGGSGGRRVVASL